MYTHYKVKSLFCRTCNNFFGTPQVRFLTIIDPPAM